MLTLVKQHRKKCFGSITGRQAEAADLEAGQDFAFWPLHTQNKLVLGWLHQPALAFSSLTPVVQATASTPLQRAATLLLGEREAGELRGCRQAPRA